MKNIFEKYGNLETLVTEALDTIISSDTTEHLIKSKIIDPFTTRYAKAIVCRGYHNCNYAMMVLFAKDPKAIISIMDDTDRCESEVQIENIIKDIKEGNREVYFIHNMSNTGRRKSYRISIAGEPVTINWIGNMEHFNFRMEIIPRKDKHHKCLNSLKKEIDVMRDKLEWFETSKNAVKVYSYPRGRVKINYASVPNSLDISTIKPQVDAVINAAERAVEVRDKYGLSKTTGVLLYGPHGTGKSTIAKYLARELNRPLVIADGDDLNSALRVIENFCDGRAILLIEDIDFKFTNRSSHGDCFTELENITSGQHTYSTPSNTISAATDLLFQIMDGSLASSNLVVVATTNYVDRLDPALIRDGRFDHRIKVDGLEYDQAVRICNTFGIDPDEIDLKEWPTPISPASLQSFILDFKVNKIKHNIPRDAVSAAMDAGESYEDLDMIDNRMRRLLVKEQGGSMLPKSEVLRQLDDLGMHDMTEMDISIIYNGINRGATYEKDAKENAITLDVSNADEKFQRTAMQAVPMLSTVTCVGFPEPEKEPKPKRRKKVSPVEGRPIVIPSEPDDEVDE